MKRLIGLTMIAALLVNAVFSGDIVVHPSQRYFQDENGMPFFFVGHYNWAAVQPGRFLSAPNRYQDMILWSSAHNIHYIRMNLGINLITGSTDPPSFDGQVSPVPFKYVGNKADLDQWDPDFWNGVRFHCELARQNGMLMHLALFDGVGLRAGNGNVFRWANSYWKLSNQVRNFYGNIADTDADQVGAFYRLDDFNNNVGLGFYQRKLIDKLLVETAEYENVFYQIGNELFKAPKSWNQALTDYIRSKTDKAITMNGAGLADDVDGFSEHRIGFDAFQTREKLREAVGEGHPAWGDPDGPESAGSSDVQRQRAWASLVSGAAGWGGFSLAYANDDYDTNVDHIRTAESYQHLMTFLEETGVNFFEMVPNHALSTSGFCLANVGQEYIAYVVSGNSVTVNISDIVGTAIYQTFHTVTGVLSNEQTIAGGGNRTITKPPGASDWAVYIKADSIPTNIPIQVGINIVSAPTNSAIIPNAHTFIQQVDSGGSWLDRVARFNKTTGAVQQAFVNPNGSLGGQNFAIVPGEGLMVIASNRATIELDRMNCPLLDLEPGINWIGTPCQPANTSAFALLRAIGEETIISNIQRFNPDTGRFDTAGYQDDRVAGVDFPIKAGEGYLINMRQNVSNFEL